MNENCGMVNITDRRKIELTGIISVDSFDEFSINLSVSCGKLCVEGENLGITVLDLDKGIVCAEGIINAVEYATEMPKEKGVMGRFFGGRR